MSTKNGRLRRCAIIPVTIAVVMAGLVIAGASAYAQTGDPPPPEPWSVQIVTGSTVLGEVVAVKQPPAPSGSGVPSGSSGLPTVTVRGARNSAPMVHDVAPYSIPHVPGTFAHRIEFHRENLPVEINVLAADSSGKAIDPSRVRIAYHTNLGQYWVFYPGTGTLEQVQAWPMVYPSRMPRVHQIVSFLEGAPGGPEWLKTARAIAVGVAAVVVIGAGAAVVGFAAGAKAALAAVPLAW